MPLHFPSTHNIVVLQRVPVTMLFTIITKKGELSFSVFSSSNQFIAQNRQACRTQNVVVNVNSVAFVTTITHCFVFYFSKSSLKWSIIDRWGTNKYLIKTIAERVKDELEKIDPSVRHRAIILFSAHSLPMKVLLSHLFRFLFDEI